MIPIMKGREFLGESFRTGDQNILLNPVFEEEFPTEMQPESKMDNFAVAVMKSGSVSGYLTKGKTEIWEGIFLYFKRWHAS